MAGTTLCQASRNRLMDNSRLRLLVLPALVVAALIYALPKTQNRNHVRAPAESSSGQFSTAGGGIPEDKTFESYGACDAAARAIAQELTDSGVRTALASRNSLAGSTVYKVYYPDATGQISCRDSRLVSEIIEQR